MSDDITWLSTAAAAERLGIHPRTLYRTRLISTRETAEFYESPRVELEGIEPSSVRWSRDALRPFP